MTTRNAVAWILALAAAAASGCGKDKGGGGAECGNDTMEQGEVCDGADLAGESCVSQGFAGGTLACNATCDGFDTAGCTDDVCGDGAITGTEACDGTNLGDPAHTCIDEGFTGGTIACLDDCQGFDTSGCTSGSDCGNGLTEFPEECDGTVPAGVDCTERGFTSGTLGCTSDCTFDVSGCVAEYCGDGIRNGAEDCDGTDLGTPAATCTSEGFTGGTLGCEGGCTFDLAACTGGCGNGTTDGTDVCDGDDVGTRTCVDEGFLAGVLRCEEDCTAYDTAGCAGSTAVCAVDGTDLGDLTAGGVALASGDTTSATDNVSASCTNPSATATRDVAFEVVLLERGRLTVFSDNTWHVLSLFGEPASSGGCFSTEIRCADPYFEGNPVDFGVLDAGRYYLVVSDYDQSLSQEFNEVVNLTAEGGEVCNNAVDDDGDGVEDCSDPDCSSIVFCAGETSCSDAVDNNYDFRVDCLDPDCVGTVDCTGASCTPDRDLGTLVVATSAGALVDVGAAGNDLDLACLSSNGPDHVFRFTLAEESMVSISVDQASGSEHAVGVYFEGGVGTGCTDNEFLCIDMSGIDDSPDISGLISSDPFPPGNYFVIVEGTTTGAGTVDVDLTAYAVSEVSCDDDVDDDGDGLMDCADRDCFGSGSCTGSACTADHDLGSIAVGAEATYSTSMSGASSTLHLSCATTNGADYVVSFTLPADSYVYTSIDQSTSSSHAVGFAAQGGTGSGCADAVFICLELAAGSYDPDASGYLTVDAPLPAGTYYAIYEVVGTAGDVEIVLRAADSLTETSCTDTVDNDGDGFVDCEDGQCGTDPACASPGRGLYELFEEGTTDTFDLDNSMLTLTPVTGHPDGFVWALRTGVSAFPFAAGGGSPTQLLSLGDDDAAEITMTTMPSFSFFGEDHGVLNVGSNGIITFGAGSASTAYFETVDGLFALPTIAAVWDDLTPDSGGSIRYDAYTNRIVVTWDAVPELEPGTWVPVGSNSFQVVLWNDGHINVSWLSVSCLDAVVGVSDGSGTVSPTPEQNFL